MIVTVNVDGHKYEIEAGGTVILKPGESITMQRGQYHSFWGEPGYGKVLVGEVSMVNDDNADNRFYEPAGRFPEIEEGEPVLYYLCSEYPRNWFKLHSLYWELSFATALFFIFLITILLQV